MRTMVSMGHYWFAPIVLGILTVGACGNGQSKCGSPSTGWCVCYPNYEGPQNVTSCDTNFGGGSVCCADAGFGTDPNAQCECNSGSSSCGTGQMSVVSCSSPATSPTPHALATCSSSSDCPGQQCQFVNSFDVGMCVDPCDTSNPSSCPTGYVCVQDDNLGLGPSCMRHCSGNGDCASGFYCSHFWGGGQGFVCEPWVLNTPGKACYGVGERCGSGSSGTFGTGCCSGLQCVNGALGQIQNNPYNYQCSAPSCSLYDGTCQKDSDCCGPWQCSSNLCSVVY